MKVRFRNILEWWVVTRVAVVLLTLTVLALGLAACGGSSGGDESGGGGRRGNAALGTVSAESDVVEHGSAVDLLEQLAESDVSFFEGDVLRVHDGGEGVLDFGDQLRLRLFNDSQLEILSVASEPDAPLDVRMFLEEGGFTGELQPLGGQVVFETPGGAEVTVLGTEFWVVYDASAKVTVVGNWGGTVEVAGAGTSVSLDPDKLIDVPDDGTPGAQTPMGGLARTDLEQLAREEQSLLVAASGYHSER
jgi:hypothetical protein